MIGNCISSWKPVTYAKDNVSVPAERWGHKFVRVSEHEIAMFGGYGGSSSDGKYLEDLWTFNLKDNRWQQIETSGAKPEPRSNYTIHFNERTQEMLLFGGGSDRKARFNCICTLNWETKVWKRILPNQTLAAPWERTYHTSEFHHPYLIIFGGESASGIDMEDMWVFNIETHQWNELGFDLQQQDKPIQRRFHSSVFLDGCFYVIGGCTGLNYSVLGDIYRVELTALFGEQKLSGFKWECLLDENQELERWGHSSHVFNDKIYISCGRVSPLEDSNQTFVFDPKAESLKVLETSSQDRPKARRRHSSMVVGSSLLVFGGYNGNYLNSFSYLPLRTIPQAPISTVNITLTENTEQMLQILEKVEQTIKDSSDLTLLVKNAGKTQLKLRSTQQSLSINPFFKQLIDHSSNKDEITLNLPYCSDILSLRLAHSVIISQSVPLSKQFNFIFFEQLLRTMEYFCCFDLHSIIEKSLLKELNKENCQHLYNISVQFSLPSLQEYAGQQHLSNTAVTSAEEKVIDFNQLESLDHLGNQEVDREAFREVNDPKTKGFLVSLSNNMKFDLQQTKLREANENIFSKTANRIRNIFASTAHETSTATVNEDEANKGCLTRIFHFIAGCCSRPKVGAQEAQSS